MTYKIRLMAWDFTNDTMVYSDEDNAVFTLKDGEWSVTYTREKTFNNGGIEIDAPVEVHSDNVEVSIYDEIPQEVKN